jgi:hypothetical protein
MGFRYLFIIIIKLNNIFFICYIWHHLTSAVNVSMSWYIYNIGVLTVNREFMWRGCWTPLCVNNTCTLPPQSLQVSKIREKNKKNFETFWFSKFFLFFSFIFETSTLEVTVVGGCMCCLRIVVSNTYCIAFLFCFSSSYVPVLPVSLDYPFWLPLRYSLTFILYVIFGTI